MLEVLGQAALRTLLLAAAVQLGLWLLRVRRPQLRLAAWTVVLAASLAMPVLQWASPLQLSVLPSLSGGEAWVQVASPHREALAPQASVSPATGDVTAPVAIFPWFEALYVAVCGVLLLRLALGTFLSLRLARKAAPVRPGWATSTRVRISRDVAAPVTVGRVVLLPWDAVHWPPALRDAVLAHEIAHVARRDFAMLLASQVNRAVFWFSPLSWWLHRRLAILAELASDDQAMATTGDRPAYAEALLEMGRRPGWQPRGVAMARPATLRYRIERVLTDREPMMPASLAQQLLFMGAAVTLSVMAASARPMPASPPGWAPPLALALSARQERSPTPADVDRPPLAARGETELAFPRVPRTEIVSDAPPQPASIAGASYGPVIRGTAQPALRPVIRSRLVQPPRPMAQRVASVRAPDAQNVMLVTGAAVQAGPALSGNGGRGSADSPAGMLGTGGQTPSFRQADQVPAGSMPPPRQGDEPSCTGVYLPKQGGPTTDGSVDVVRAMYFQEADGTPWLKLLLGARNRARLNGLDVERISYRTTVVMTLPRGTRHVAGTTRGTYGSIDYECVRPPQRS